MNDFKRILGVCLLVTYGGIAAASHRLGIVVNENQVIGNGDQVLNFNDPNAMGGKFAMLHFNGSIPAGDSLTVQLGYGVDTFDSTSGANFWSRPVRADAPIMIEYNDNGDNVGSVTLHEFGLGLGLQGGGSTNANGDFFLMDSPYQEPSPSAQYYMGKYPAGSDPNWQNVASLPNGIMKQTAESVGMVVWEEDNKITSCSVTLVDADLILTAGHCLMSDSLAASASVTFDFETNADGTRPGGYDPVFHKVTRVVPPAAHQVTSSTPYQTLDYAFLQIETPPEGLGIPPIEFHPNVNTLNAGDPLFIIHHPRGSSKKVSNSTTDPGCVVGAGSQPDWTHFECDVDNGSSGSSIFDAQGRIVANLSWWDAGTSANAIRDDITTDLPPGQLDTIIVFDRSGSMSLPSGLGTTKLEEADAAASLFVNLINSAGGHNAGLVSFSTSTVAPAPSPNIGLGPLNNDAAKVNLTNTIGLLTANGSTAIGSALSVAKAELNAGDNTPSILLLTDGLQNTGPSIDSVNLGNTRLNIIGFGNESSLDGPRMTTLARDHGGIYTRAGSGLELQKFFALAFGELFNDGASLDPYFQWQQDETTIDSPMTFKLASEDELTVVMGWEQAIDDKWIEVVSPSGKRITARTPGVTSKFTDRWAFLKIPLPFDGDQQGEWQVVGERGFSTEFFEGTPENFFLTTIVNGGPRLDPIITIDKYYTGDALIPLVSLLEDGARVEDAVVTLEITRPATGSGNFLTEVGLSNAIDIAGDILDRRTATLLNAGFEQDTISETIELFDDADHGDGSPEEDGIFGNFYDSLLQEGSYDFRAVAEFADGVTRETSWSIFVEVGVSAEASDIDLMRLGQQPDGRERAVLFFTPKDDLGNFLGPGRGELFELNLVGAEAEFVGELLDLGDGQYQQEVIWDPDRSRLPLVTLTQDDRIREILTPEPNGTLIVLVLACVSLRRRKT